jgi:hypothetical protein
MGSCELRILPETSPQKGGGSGKQLHSLHQLRNADPEPFGEDLQQWQAYILLSRFNLRDVSSIYAELVRHFDLRQSFLDS